MEKNKDIDSLFYCGKSKMKQPSVSVIVPVYKVERYIERCANSLFAQTLEDIEFIFVDDCSPDDSIQILMNVLNSYPERKDQVKIYKHDTNKGLSFARNTGLNNATGEYIIHCDSDDWVEVDMYEKMYQSAKLSKADIVACDYYMHYSNSTEVHCALDRDVDCLNFLKSYISSGWTVIWNLLIKGTLYKEYNIEEYEGCDFGEDYGLSVRLLSCSTKYTRVPLPLYHYNRTNINSIVRNSLSIDNLNRTTNSLITINSKITDFFISKGIYEELLEVLSWRMLAGKRGWLYQKDKRKEYRSLFPESNRFILSNPFCSKKDKLCQTIILYPVLSWLLPIIKYMDKIRRTIK